MSKLSVDDYEVMYPIPTAEERDCLRAKHTDPYQLAFRLRILVPDSLGYFGMHAGVFHGTFCHPYEFASLYHAERSKASPDMHTADRVPAQVKNFYTDSCFN